MIHLAKRISDITQNSFRKQVKILGLLLYYFTMYVVFYFWWIHETSTLPFPPVIFLVYESPADVSEDTAVCRTLVLSNALASLASFVFFMLCTTMQI